MINTTHRSNAELRHENMSLHEIRKNLLRYVCLDQLFAHLDKFRQSCLSKDSHAAESFLARSVLQEAFTNARASEKVSFVSKIVEHKLRNNNCVQSRFVHPMSQPFAVIAGS